MMAEGHEMRLEGWPRAASLKDLVPPPRAQFPQLESSSAGLETCNS